MKHQLELDERQVHLEKLSYYKTSQPIMLFERTLKDGQSVVQINQNAEKISAAAKEMISINCLKNISFFVARNNVNVSLPIIDAAKDWMRNQLMPVIFPTMDLTSYAQNNQSVLPIDEVETSLHPKLLEKILFEYLKTPSRSQIIVTSGA